MYCGIEIHDWFPNDKGMQTVTEKAQPGAW